MRTLCSTFVLLLTACAWVLGIEPGVLENGEAGADEPSPSGDSAPDGCRVYAQAEVGVFVTPQAGGDSPECGTLSTPCTTINAAVKRAKSAGKSTLYLSKGTYVESVALESGLVVWGGWEAFPTAWLGSCDANARSLTVIQAPEDANVTVRATDLTGVARLVTLTIRSKQTASPSESTYALLARGSSTTVALDDVSLIASPAGNGFDGAPGGAGPDGSGGCVAGSGASSMATGGVGFGGAPGWFGVDGYTSTPGAPGLPGGVGDNGVAGSAPTCVSCVTCNALVTCTATGNGQSCGGKGTSGCGGGGGKGGEAGQGGGSSIGLYAWDATVTIKKSAIASADGGRGGSGGLGGSGGKGGTGADGSDGSSCTIACGGVLCTATGTDHGRGGSAGGTGGAGAWGGRGGGGSGGSSYAIYRGPFSHLTIDAQTTLSHGAAGSGGDGAAKGNAGDQFP